MHAHMTHGHFHTQFTHVIYVDNRPNNHRESRENTLAGTWPKLARLARLGIEELVPVQLKLHEHHDTFIILHPLVFNSTPVVNCKRFQLPRQ